MNLHLNGNLNPFQFDSTLATFVAYNREDPLPVSYTTPMSVGLEMDVVRFGEGYVKVSSTGINTRVKKINAVWENRSRVVVDALLKFFMGDGANTVYDRNISEFFYWLPPYPFRRSDDQHEKFIVIEEIEVEPIQFDAWTLKASLEQVFNP